MKNKETSKHCIGCVSLICYKEDNINGDCPCTHCLIKMVCDLQCEEYSKYHRAMELKWGEEDYDK